MRSKPLSMKQRFGLKKIKLKCLYCNIWSSVSFYIKKQNNWSFLKKKVKEWSKKGKIPEVTVGSDRNRDEVYYLKE